MKRTAARAGAALLCCAALAALAEPVSIKRRTPAGQEALLRTHAHWNSNCQATTLPRITWMAKPVHGTVDERVGEVTAGGNLVGSVPCIGIRMRGVLIYYQPEPGFRGVDSFSYEVRYDARDPIVQFEGRVAVE